MHILLAGFLVADIVAADLERVAEPGELVLAPRGIRLSVGGHPANIAVDLVKLGLPPESITVVSTVGRDIFGEFIVRTLRSYGINLMVEVAGDSTNKNVILVVRGEDRRFHVELSSSTLMRASHVMGALERVNPDIFYIATGIIGEVDERLEDVLKRAKSLGSLTFVDTVKPVGKSWDFLRRALRHVDVFHCNSLEAVEIAGVDDLESAVDCLAASGVKLLFVTLGEGGAIATSRRYRVRQRAFRVEVVDPTGAGDAFCAGVILRLAEAYGERLRSVNVGEIPLAELCEILAFAQAVGASACTAPGTTAGVSRELVEELLRSQASAVMRAQEVVELG